MCTAPALAAGSSPSATPNIPTPQYTPYKDPTPSTSPSTSPGSSDDIKWKVSGKINKTPPFIITLSDTVTKSDEQQSVPYTQTLSLDLYGRYDFSGLAGMWDFSFSGDFKFESNNTYGGIINAGIDARAILGGSGRGEVVGPDINANVKADQLCKEWKPGPDPSTYHDPNSGGEMTPAPVITDDEYQPGQTVQVSKPDKPPTVKYTADFTLDAEGTVTTLNAWATGPNASIDGNFLDAANATSQGTVRFKLEIYSDFTVKCMVDIQSTGSAVETFGPYYGLLTSGEELDANFTGSKDIPIWGDWAEKSPFDALPDVETDYAAVQKALANGNTPKEIDYPKDNWLELTKGGKGQANTYKRVSVSSTSIYYETGELWPAPDCYVCHPSQCASYDLSLQYKTDGVCFLRSLKLQYEKNIDRLSTNIYPNMLYRLKDAPVSGGKPDLNGDFSSDESLTAMPGLPDDLDAALALEPGVNYISLDVKAETFTWFQRTQSPDGVLVLSGAYSANGLMLVLSRIKGSFYPAPGEAQAAFNDVDYGAGYKAFQYTPERDTDRNIISVDIDGIGILKPITAGDQ